MPNTKELLENRAAPHKAMADLLKKSQDEKRDLTAEEAEQFDKAEKDYDSLTSQIERLERFNKINKEIGSPANGGHTPGRDDPSDGLNEQQSRTSEPKGADTRDQMTAFRAWGRSQIGKNITDDDQEACKRSGISPNQPELEILLSNTQSLQRFRHDWERDRNAEYRALSALEGSAGGFLVPEGFTPELERALLQFGGARPAFTIKRTASGEDLPMPLRNDTNNKGRLIGENKPAVSTDIVYQQKILHAYEATSDFVLVPVALFEDSAFDIASEVGNAIGERLGRLFADKIINGDGAAEPEGLLEATPKGIDSAAVATLAADDLIRLQHSVDPAYRGNASFIFHDTIHSLLRRLKTGVGEYLFFDSQRGEFGFDRLLGSRFFVDQEMPATDALGNVSTGQKPVLFGDMSKHVVREVRSVTIRRLVERFAEFNQEAFLGWMRFDSKLMDAGTGPIKHLLIA